MIREAAQNIIDHHKYLLNEKNKKVERNNKNLIEAEQNMGQEKYGECILYSCQTNLYESSYTTKN